MKSFTHKGTRRYYETGSKSGIQPKQSARLRLQLAAADTARVIDDMAIPVVRRRQIPHFRRPDLREAFDSSGSSSCGFVSVVEPTPQAAVFLAPAVKSLFGDAELLDRLGDGLTLAPNDLSLRQFADNRHGISSSICHDSVPLSVENTNLEAGPVFSSQARRNSGYRGLQSATMMA